MTDYVERLLSERLRCAETELRTATRYQYTELHRKLEIEISQFKVALEKHKAK